MPHITSKSTPKTAPLQQHASTLHPSIQKMVHIRSLSSVLPEKMAVKSDPVAIGTRGTVGSLIMQEIDYFSRLQLGDGSKTKTRAHRLEDVPSTNEFFKQKVESVINVPKKKKRGSKRFVPSMCSVVEVVDSNERPNSSSGFAYKNLKADLKRLQP